jgi:beta-lactamase regulating signal transducer with metallopeptidase domain
MQFDPINQPHSIVAEPSQQSAPALAPVAARESNEKPLPTPVPIWPIAVSIVYILGVLILLFQLAIGWRGTVRIAKSATEVGPTGPITNMIPGDALIRESELVATPLTIGIFSQRIILPTSWRLWPDEKLRAVLAHEFAHVQRRDFLVGLLAHLNRCLFWFHPLAWWLERKLAVTAEHACDDAAVRAIGKTRSYAEVLLDMAESVRRTGSRFSWQGVGVGGTGLLGQRIDRILRGDLFREMSRTRKVVVAVSCAAAIFLIVACRRQLPPPAPLQPDPKYAAEQDSQKARSEFYQAARTMNPQQVADLEATVKKNPEDLVNLEKLLVFYAPISEAVKGEKGKWAPICAQVIGEKECIAARLPHILWLIQHHPDHKLAGDWPARIYPTSLDPLPDPAGYAEARKLWIAQSSQPDAALQVFKNAANFFEVADKPLAEKMLLRAQTLDPKGKYSYSLGRLYAITLVGSNSSMPLNVVRSKIPSDARTPYALEIRKKLADSTDAALLFAAGQYLAHERDRNLEFDAAALGKSYMERAQQLRPDMFEANLTLLSQRIGERDRHLAEVLRNVPKESQYQAVSALPESERFNYLPGLASTAYMMGEWYDYTKDQAKAKESWDHARKYAQDALQLAPKLRNHAEYGTAIYIGNLVLGALTFREGNRQAAVNYMLAASQAPASEDFDLHMFFHTKLTAYLLKYGERDSVIEFLERISKVSVAYKSDLLEAAGQIRKGIQPIWYPRENTNQAQGHPK